MWYLTSISDVKGEFALGRERLFERIIMSGKCGKVIAIAKRATAVGRTL